MKTDSLFYRLFKQRPSLLFELTGLPAGSRYFVLDPARDGLRQNTR